MADKNQTPAPKVSNNNTQGVKGQREELAIEHLETGTENGIAPDTVDTTREFKTTTQKQEEQEKRIKNGHDSLDIPYGNEGEGKKK